MLAKIIDEKCKEINRVYPRAKILLSLLLPTKSSSLNQSVKRFNKLLVDLAYSAKYINVVDNCPLFGSVLDDKFGRWDSKNNSYLDTDSVHLGKLGLKLFAKNIKSHVVGAKPKSRSRINSSSSNRGRAGVSSRNHVGSP